MIALCPPVTDETAENISKCIDVDPEKLDDILSAMSNCQRPSIPENITLGDEYKYVLELFYCCTSQDKAERPTASELTAILQDIYVKN